MNNSYKHFTEKGEIWKNELVSPYDRFKDYIDNAVVFFGSARIEGNHPLKKYYDDSYHIAKGVGEFIKNNNLKSAISTGGGPGIMTAVNKGAHDSGVPSLGMTIELPFEEVVNEFIDENSKYDFEYFFTRKYWCLKVAKVVVAIPGGVGTLDEVMETLVLLQTNKMKKNVPIILYGKEFWRNVINFDYLKDNQVITDYKEVEFTDTVQETIDKICEYLK